MYNNMNRQSFPTKDRTCEKPTFDFTKIDEKLFSKTAEEYAKSCVSKKDTSTQIRRFYNELLYWNEKCTDDLENNLPFIRMIKAKAAYALGRSLISKEFKEMLDAVINNIEDQKTLKNAKLFFEAFVGYFKYYEKAHDE